MSPLDSVAFQEQTKNMANKIMVYAEGIYDFENPENQQKARSVIPLDLLKKRAQGKYLKSIQIVIL